ncbi:MAG: deoxyguanosinetriphosphate triphosphohydrolase [Candidatus Pseudoruminococcus sp.]|uniref:deoxyguanosinetriphosphate triphosphohydrolase n=1 Tax=Candidatus Pseudoruminococcus sp. TaxID=3101048 RepID=UPI002A786610|nr:deoxyguanosinetriphosphate triphosphohydrolase [Ruminococcus sp.]MDY2783850.1 deoxyguanosinetriphosphate triphosphohydrolase [Candidatus Pseudoruminococcus sp.]
MNIREQTENIEKTILSPFAKLASESEGRLKLEQPCLVRTCFQRDRDRIIHCKSFRRLKHKTQVFLSPEGDHYRTRLTHTLEVSQIARTIAKALRLNEDLTEAISLGHDLGHTPFGHAGEKALDGISPSGFRHYEQSLRVVDFLEKDGKGLNLTYETRDGILNHTKGKEATTLEGRIVRLADRIAYINHDIDDAIRADIISENDIPKKISKVLGDNTSERIDRLVISVIANSQNGILSMDSEMQSCFDELHSFMFDRVYLNNTAKKEEKKIPKLIEALYEYFYKHIDEIPSHILIHSNGDTDRAVCDYIAGMTDKYAVELFKEIFIPKSWSKTGKNLA